MRACPKPINEQTFVELADCALEQAKWLVGRIFESYAQVFFDPAGAWLLDWALVLATISGAAALVAKGILGKAE